MTRQANERLKDGDRSRYDAIRQTWLTEQENSVPLVVIPAAVKQLKADATRILEALGQVAADLNTRFSFVTEMVSQPGTWRLRKGDWRAAYTIEGNDVVVTPHRKQKGHLPMNGIKLLA
jgi:hypothetical protein